MYFSTTWARAWRQVARVGLAFALIGFLIGLRTVAVTTLPHILQPGSSIGFQELTDGLPVPRLLDWNTTVIDGLMALQSLSAPLLWLASLLFCTALWLLAAAALNPTFRLFRPDGAADTTPSPSGEPTPVSLAEDAAVPHAAASPIEPATEESETPSTIDPAEATSTEPPVDSMAGAPPAVPAEEEDPATAPEEMQESLPEEAAVEVVPADYDPSSETETTPPISLPASPGISLEGGRLVKAVRLFVQVGVPLLALWVLAGWLGGEEPPYLGGSPTSEAANAEYLPWLVRLVALGIALWMGLRPDGYAGNFARPYRNDPGAATRDLIQQGFLFGVILYALARWVLPGSLPGLLDHYQMLGAFNRAYWRDIAGFYLGSMTAVWFAAGALLVLIGQPGLRAAQRLVLAVLPAAALLLAVAVERPYTPRALAARLDITPAVIDTIEVPYQPKFPASGIPNGVEAGQELARRLHLILGPAAMRLNRSVLYFLHGPDVPNSTAITVRQQGYTEDGLTADPASAARVRAFLEQRHFRTALSWVAIKHLYNVATVHFDATSALAVGLQDMMRCPHAAQFGRVLRDMFFVCAASPQNLALLDQYADEANFDHFDRDSRKLMGDMYVRFGAVQKALAWYGRAEMPKTFMARVRQERPMFHQGHVAGVLRLNGKPLVGVQVGVVPVRLNGLPTSLKLDLLNLFNARPSTPTEGELIHPYFTPGFPRFYPRPFAFRWISAGTTTDANGAFTLDNLTEGEYVLVCTLPPEVRLTPPIDQTLTVHHAPASFVLNYKTPSVDLGAIDLSFPKPSTPPTP